MESFKTTTETNEAPQAPRLIERLRVRTPESIETFDINKEGLAIHGTKLERLESVLMDGLGSFKSTSRCGEVWFNVVGTPAISQKEDSKMDTRIGFGGDRTMFGGEVVLVSDVFKEMWPNMVNGIVKLGHAANGLGGEIRIEFELGVTSINIDFTGNDWHKADWSDIEELPEPEEMLIPEFKKEEMGRSPSDGKKQVDVGRVVTNSKKTVWYGNEYFEQISLPPYQQLLGRAAFNAIVVTDSKRGSIPTERTVESIVEEIIEIQNRIKIPKEEQLPVFNESGKCLYNPLTQ